MTIKNTKKLTVIICRDDKTIIERMKQIGVWKKMKEQSKPRKTISILVDDELFIWHGVPGDSGYSHIKCDNPGELLFLAFRALSSSP